MKKKLYLIVAGIITAGVLSVTLPELVAQTPPPAAPAAPAAKRAERHPKIRVAIRALEEAKKEMQTADHDFGGHRKAALDECDKAIEQLKLALQFDKQ